MIKRIKKEKEILQKAKLNNQLFSSFEALVEEALKIAESENECVIGHGDFKPDNILVSDEEVIPVDWIDFGKCMRWYEVGTLLFDCEQPKYAENLSQHYRDEAKVNNISPKEALRRGYIITGVIQIGSHARQVMCHNEPYENHRNEIYRIMGKLEGLK